VIETIPFGRTGHQSTRMIFGAAAIGAMSQERADAVLESLRESGVNHIDVAAMYGDAEERLAPFLAAHRSEFFLATKTRDRSREKARESIRRSLERMRVDQIDLIQLHNLTDDPGWQRAMGSDGALAAAVEARDEGLVRFIGVTGHGTFAPEMHLRSLTEFEFDSVLLPYNPTMMASPQYARDFDALLAECERRSVAVQTIKSIARRRWRDDDPAKRFSWYEPIREPEALARAVGFALRRPGIFVNTSSDATLLPLMLDAGSRFGSKAEAEDDTWEADVAADMARLEVEPLFVRGVSDSL
jgi:aryl-alcohol dehydrogenase-like predicted oxidoreductase